MKSISACIRMRQGWALSVAALVLALASLTSGAAEDAYFMYKANWNPEPMLHLCGKRLRGIERGKQKVDVVAFLNVGDVTLTVNGKAIGTKTPDEIKAVTFGSVPLSVGANNIVVEAGNLRDEYSCKVMDL